MCGSAGTGKSMVDSRIPTILPGLTREEDIEISRIYSVCGKLPPGRPLLLSGPFAVPNIRFLLRVLRRRPLSGSRRIFTCFGRRAVFR